MNADRRGSPHSGVGLGTSWVSGDATRWTVVVHARTGFVGRPALGQEALTSIQHGEPSRGPSGPVVPRLGAGPAPAHAPSPISGSAGLAREAMARAMPLPFYDSQYSGALGPSRVCDGLSLLRMGKEEDDSDPRALITNPTSSPPGFSRSVRPRAPARGGVRDP